MTTNKTVARAERLANAFAEAARRNPDNIVLVETDDSRTIPSSNLQRTFKVLVENKGTGQFTSCSWTVDVEKPTWGNRSVRYFGWGYSSILLKSKRISLSLAYIRIR